MGRKNNSLQIDKELKELVEKYEVAEAENQQIYLDADQLADIADLYVTLHRYKEAEKVIEYGLKIHPENTILLIEQAYLYLDTRRVAQAQEVADSITETYETNVKLLKAELLLFEGNLQEAEVILNSIRDADDLDVIIDVIYLYLDMGYPKNAKKWLKSCKEEYKKNEDYIAITADYLAHTNQIDEAMIYYERLIDFDSYNTSYWMGLAKCYFSKLEIDKTIEACDFALAADEECGEAYSYRAHSYLYLDNCDEAIKNYEKALEYKSIPPEMAYMFMGAAYASKEEWANAIKCYDAVIQAFEEAGDPDSFVLIDPYNSKGYAEGKLGNYEEAHRLCDKAAILAPDDIMPPFTQGRIYLMQGLLEEARKAFREISSEDTPKDIYYQIANDFSDLDMIEDAKEYYIKTSEIDLRYEDTAEKLCLISIMEQNVEDFFKYNNECKQPIDEDAIARILAGDHREEDRATFEKILEFMKKINKSN